MKIRRFTLGAGLVLWALALDGFADDHGRHGRHDRHHRPEWRGDIHRFHEHDADLWRSGRWRHGRHDGRLGWWWIVAGAWYFYPTQTLPYPDPYQPPVVTLTPPAPPQQYWYYCANPAGYYPYVARCRVVWQAVPARVDVPR